MLRLFVPRIRNRKVRTLAPASATATPKSAAAAKPAATPTRAPITPLTSAAIAAIETMESRTLLSGNGLAATYFNNADLTGSTASRVDATVNFDWGTGSPTSAIGADTFSARWTGSVVPTKSETYTFYTSSDDGVRVWVDGKQVINDWTVHAPREDKGTISLVAGKQYNIKVEYYEQSAGAVMKLLWSSPSTAKAVIPQSQLYSTAAATAVTPPASSTPTPVPAPSTGAGTGTGLAAVYYDNADLTGKTAARTDGTVNFTWSAAPISGIALDTFSTRWTGQVQAQKTEEYTFYTQSDDGVRLWVNGVQIINNWSAHGSTENSGKIKLTAGAKYDIKLEYFNRSGNGTAQLKWSSPTTAKAIVPRTQLYSTTAVTPPSSVPPTSTPTPTPPTTSTGGITSTHGLLATFFNNLDFTGNQISRYDSSVQYDWGTSSPHEVIGKDSWAARWQGQVVANKSETHTFYITSDGGARLWVDGKLVINDWGDHAKREVSGQIYLTAGRHDIKMEYELTSGSAVMQFRWSTPSIAKNFVPNSNLFAAAPPALNLAVPPVSANTGFKVYTSKQVNFRPGGATDKSLTVDGYRISKIPIDTKGLNIAVTDLVPGQKAFAYKNITIKNTEISDIYRTPGFHNDFIRIAGAAGRQDVPMNITLENIKIHDGQAIPILITDGDYDTIVIRNVSITNCTVAQLQINTQNVGSVKRIIVENCPGLSVAITGRPGTVGQVFVRNSPGSRVADSLMADGRRTGALMTIMP